MSRHVNIKINLHPMLTHMYVEASSQHMFFCLEKESQTPSFICLYIYGSPNKYNYKMLSFKIGLSNLL